MIDQLHPKTKPTLVNSSNLTYPYFGHGASGTSPMLRQAGLRGMAKTMRQEFNTEFTATGLSFADAPHYKNFPGGKITVGALVLYGNEVDGGASRIISKRNTAQNSDDYCLQVAPTTINPEARLNGNQISHSTSIDVTNTPYFHVMSNNPGEWYSMIWVPDSQTFEVQPGTAQSSINTSTEALTIGHRASSDRSMDGAIILCFVLNEFWTQEKARQWMRDPWSIFKHPELRLPTGAPASGDQTISPTGIVSAGAFGSSQVNLGIDATGIASIGAFGTPNAGFGISPTGIASADAYGTAALSRNIQPTGLVSAMAFGTAVVTSGLIISPSGFTSTAFGTQQVNLGIDATGFEESAFGTHNIGFGVSPTGITSGEGFGSPQVNLIISPTAFGGEVFGLATVTGGAEPEVNIRWRQIGLPINNNRF
jgi:hypothetical protein